MSSEEYYQPELPGMGKQIRLCGCSNPAQDKQYGKHKRSHTFRKGVWNGKHTPKLWYCDSCGMPYFSEHLSKNSAKYRR